jgi:nitrile hydratase accessory protein
MRSISTCGMTTLSRFEREEGRASSGDARGVGDGRSSGDAARLSGGRNPTRNDGAWGTRSLLDQSAEAERFAVLPPLPRDDDGPVFAEPWQAQAFAMAVSLSRQGHFTWSEWAAALAAELKAAEERGEPDVEPKTPVRRASAVRDVCTRYYEHWLAALERLIVEKGLSDWAALAQRREAWVEAYRRTPHGKPVELPSRT